MKYLIDKALTNKYPDFIRGVVVAREVHNDAPMIKELYDLLLNKMDKIERSDAGILNSPKIRKWGEVYQTFPVKKRRKVKPSVQTLIERIRKGKRIPFISPLVCIANLVSLKYLNPGGLVDVDKVQGNVVLGFAKGDESFLPFGTKKEMNPEPGEVIFYDDRSKAVLCGAWNSRGGQTTMVTPGTKNTFIDIDVFKLDEQSETDLQEALSFTKQLIEKYCGASTTSFLLGNADREKKLPF